MKRLFTLILAALALLVGLAGCMPVDSTGYTDPYAMRSQADSLRQAADSAIMATEQARSLISQRATIEAGRLQDQAAATATAFDMAQRIAAATATAGAEQAQATATAQANQSATQTAAPYSATKTAAAWEAWQTKATATAAAQVRQERAALVSYWAGILWRVLLPLGLAALFVLGLWVIWSNRDQVRRLIEAKELQARMIDRGPNKDPLTALRLKDGRIIFYDPARLPGAAAIIGPHGVEVTGLGNSPALAASTVARAQATDLVRAFPHDPTERKRAVQMVNALEAAQPDPLPDLPSVAPWQLFTPDPGGALPLGVGADGRPVLADPETSPHFLFAGTTGSGKTRAGLRPLAAAALAAGWQVKIFDPSGLDFLPFNGCPNAELVTLAQPEQAITYLQALFTLIRDRQTELKNAGCSTWGRLPGAGPRVLAVFDEFSNLADSLPNGERESLWRSARMVAAEGRKAGVHLALALQDPTHKSIDLRIRRNMTPIAYRVRDPEASRVVLNAGGAESLAPRQFMAALGLALVRGVGWSPDDSELAAWLNSRPLPALPDDNGLILPRPVAPVAQPERIIESVTESRDSGADPDPESGGDLRDSGSDPGELHGCTRDQVKQVLDMARQGLSQTSIESVIFGFTGGAAYRKIKAILDDPQALTFAGGATTTGDDSSVPLPAAFCPAD